MPMEHEHASAVQLLPAALYVMLSRHAACAMQEEGFPESPAMPFTFRIKLWALCMGNILVMMGWQKVHLLPCLTTVKVANRSHKSA